MFTFIELCKAILLILMAWRPADAIFLNQELISDWTVSVDLLHHGPPTFEKTFFDMLDSRGNYLTLIHHLLQTNTPPVWTSDLSSPVILNQQTPG